MIAQNMHARCPNSFVWALSFDELQGLVQHEVAMDGYDASIASLVSIQFADGGAGVSRTNEILTACITRYLVISGNQVCMVGM